MVNAVPFIPALVFFGTTVYLYLRLRAERQRSLRLARTVMVQRVTIQSQERRLCEFPRSMA